MSLKTLSHPSVIWAQRKNCVFLTLCLEDVKEPEIRTEAGGVYFKGKGGSDGKEYEAHLDLFGSIDPSSSLHVIRPRSIEFCLKKEEDNFWPRLLKSQAKCPWLKIDFNKWKSDFEEMMRRMGLLGGAGGMGGMGGIGGMPGMPGTDEEQGEGGGPPGMGMDGMVGGDGGTDFEEMMRQMRLLGGAGGMGGMGGNENMPGMPGMDKPSFDDLGKEETDSDDHEDLPDLE